MMRKSKNIINVEKYTLEDSKGLYTLRFTHFEDRKKIRGGG
jgi:hypothetical protein